MSSNTRSGDSAPEERKKLAGGVSHRHKSSLTMEPRRGTGRKRISAPPPLPGLMREDVGNSGGLRHRLISVGPPGPFSAFTRRPVQ